MTISAERREELYLKTISANEVPVRDVRLSADELRTLLHDSARLERIEREAKELASRLEYCDHAVERQVVRPIGRELRAIVDTGRGDCD